MRKGKKEAVKNRRGQKWDARFAIAISEKSCLVVINLRAAIKKKKQVVGWALTCRPNLQCMQDGCFQGFDGVEVLPLFLM